MKPNMPETTKQQREREQHAEPVTDKPAVDSEVKPPTPKAKPIPVAIQRLMDEVRIGQATPHGLFDRWHNRHNRS